MNITFYKCSCESHRVDKSNYIENVITMSGSLRNACSVTNPVVRIQYDENSSPALLTANYFYIDEFNRYYFIDDKTIESSTIYSISGTCDTLFSAKTEILNLEPIVARQETNRNTLLVDSKATSEAQEIYDLIDADANSNHISTDTISDTTLNYLLIMQGEYILPTTSIRGMHDDTVGTRRYVVTHRELDSIMTQMNSSDFADAVKFISSTKPIESISSIRCYPYILADSSDMSANVKIGAWDTGISAKLLSQTKPKTWIQGASFDLRSYDATWEDLAGDCQIYVQFYGFTAVQPQELFGHIVKIAYLPSFNTGNALVKITSDGKVIQQVTCKIGQDLPYSQSNTAEIIRNVISAGATTTNQIIASVGSENYVATAGAVVSGINNTLNALNQHTYRGGSVSDTITGYYLQESKILLAKRKYIYPANYGSLYGYPCYKKLKLSTLVGDGFTQIQDVHMEGFKTYTSPEIQDIESKLKTGVIL